MDKIDYRRNFTHHNAVICLFCHSKERGIAHGIRQRLAITSTEFLVRFLVPRNDKTMRVWIMDLDCVWIAYPRLKPWAMFD